MKRLNVSQRDNCTQIQNKVETQKFNTNETEYEIIRPSLFCLWSENMSLQVPQLNVFGKCRHLNALAV